MPELNYKEKAKAIWDVMGVSKRAGVQIGMFPQIVMKATESEGYRGTQLAVALMNVSKEQGEGTSAAAPSVTLPPQLLLPHPTNLKIGCVTMPPRSRRLTRVRPDT